MGCVSNAYFSIGLMRYGALQRWDLAEMGSVEQSILLCFLETKTLLHFKICFVRKENIRENISVGHKMVRCQSTFPRSYLLPQLNDTN